MSQEFQNQDEYTQEHEISLQQYQQALEYLKQNKQAEALQSLNTALTNNTRNPKIYLSKALTHFNMKEYQKCIETCEKGLVYSQNDSILYTMSLSLSMLKIEAQIQQGLTKEAKRDIYILNELISKWSNNNEEYDQEVLNKTQNMLEQLEQKIQQNVSRFTKEDRQRQAQQFIKLMDVSIVEEYMKTQGAEIYIVSTKWLKKWEQYTNFENITLSKNKTDGNQPKRKKSEFEDSQTNHNNNNNDNNDNDNLIEQIEYPGPIDASDLIEWDSDNLLLDTDITQKYCNYSVKSNLRENEDFILLTKNTWKYLLNIYGGQEIIRYVISEGDSNTKLVEIWLQKIYFRVVGSSNNFIEKQYHVNTSKQNTVKSLKEKLSRILKNTFNQDQLFFNEKLCKIWKIDTQDNLQNIINAIQLKQNIVEIEATLLDDNQKIEDAEISQNDVLLIEYKHNDKWLLASKKQIDPSEMYKYQCGNCLKTDVELLYCQCMTIKYCGEQCQRNHRNNHKEKCQKVQKEKSKLQDILQSLGLTPAAKFKSSSRYGLTGLQNLGNTCFMNSTLQCMSQVPELSRYMFTNEFVKDLNTQNPLGTGGYLAVAYAELIKQLHAGDDKQISPWNFKKIISKKATQFQGFGQHDSQELLAYLLDGLHEDLNKIKKKPFIEIKDNDDRSNEIVAREQWENHLKRNQSVIVDLMHGQFKSTLICPDCQKVSITFDPFNTLSVPLPNSKPTELQLYYIYQNTKNTPQKFIIKCLANTLLSDIKQHISNTLGYHINNFIFALISNHEILEIPEQHRNVSYLENHSGAFFSFELEDQFNNQQQQQQLYIELSIYKLNNKNIQEKATFTRILTHQSDITLEQLELLIYKYMRHYLYQYYQQETNNKISSIFNMQSQDNNEIEQEFTKLFNSIKAYTLQIYIKSKKFTENLILNNKNMKLQDRLSDLRIKDTNDICINIILNKSIQDIKQLKLNKCIESQNQLKIGNDQKNVSIYDCIQEFTQAEKLEKGNEWYCNKCQEHKLVTKKIEIFKVPPILIIHLKRFKTNRGITLSYIVGERSQKIDSYIDFPIEGLDLQQYIEGYSKQDKQTSSCVYDLFAVSNHYGGLGGGHYTATCLNSRDSQWYEFNDSHVQKASQKDIKSASAYVLFYRQRNYSAK